MKKKINRLAIAVAVASLPGTALLPLSAKAQTDSIGVEGSLEEILVTARKRTENLQDVGLSVSAMTQTEISRTFARDIKDLAFISPNLIIDDTSQGPGGNGALYIRGVGVADVEKNFDPAVGVTVDGLFIGANSGALLRSIDLASVEILRGPQGTLFGRNTIGGTINVERTRPTGELGGAFRAGYADYDTFYLDGVLNFGLGEDFAVKLSAAKHDQQEGYFDNTQTGDDNGEVDYEAYGINLLWTATDKLEFEYTYQDESTDQDTPPLTNMAQPDTVFCSAYGYCAKSLSTPSSGDRYKVNTLGFLPATASDNPDGVVISDVDDLMPTELEASFDTETHILEGRWEINDAMQLTYIYGKFETDETIVSNWTSEPEMLFGTDRPAEYEQESHELRLNYDTGGRLSFVAGGFYWESEYEIRLRSWITFNPDFPGQVVDIPQKTRQFTDSQALFFEGDYRFNDQWTLTLGGRYTEDDKESRQFGNLNTGPDHPDEDWDEFTPKVGLRYQATEDAMVYATYAKGYRSGGFNGRVDSQDTARIPYDPETVDNYELGIKSEWMNNRLRFNGAIFYMEYDDKQEEIGLPSEGATGQRITVFNAAEATMQGVELELQAAIGEGLNMRANLGYLDSEYDEFTFEGPNGLEDLSGLDFRRAPEWTGSVDATYTWDLGRGQAWVRGAYRFLGEHFIEQTNRPELENDDQHIVDASINYAIDAFQFSLFGKNLTEEDGWEHGLNVSGLWAYASPRAPRIWGFEVTYDFDAE